MLLVNLRDEVYHWSRTLLTFQILEVGPGGDSHVAVVVDVQERNLRLLLAQDEKHLRDQMKKFKI